MSDLTLSGARLLLADGTIQSGSLALAGGLIAEISSDDRPGLDAGGFLVLPGIVDLHGDASQVTAGGLLQADRASDQT